MESGEQLEIEFEDSVDKKIICMDTVRPLSIQRALNDNTQKFYLKCWSRKTQSVIFIELARIRKFVFFPTYSIAMKVKHGAFRGAISVHEMVDQPNLNLLQRIVTAPEHVGKLEEMLFVRQRMK